MAAINSTFTILANEPPADKTSVSALIDAYKEVPDEYLNLVAELTELELEHENGTYLRIWSPDGCLDQDEGYEVSKRIPGAIPIGDDGGGRILVYMNGAHGDGLYCVGYGDIARDDATFVSNNLTELLKDGIGIEAFGL